MHVCMYMCECMCMYACLHVCMHACMQMFHIPGYGAVYYNLNIGYDCVERVRGTTMSV